MYFHVGLPTHDDWDGVYFTVVSLLNHHPLVKEITVIDNAPEKAEVALKLSTFCKSAGVRYQPLPFPKGPCGAKDMAFRVSKLPTVCIDSHVLLRSGSFEALADAWVDQPILYQGPLMNANGTVHATHLRDIYGTDGMRGTWSTGHWDGEKGFDAPGVDLVTGVPGVYGKPVGTLADATKPVEIGAHGCGLLACDPKYWPGFNPRMRGFGGEEWYIQDKMRKRGGKVLLVPKLQWIHRWACERPGGVTHRPLLWDKIRNQVIGAQELGLDIERIRKAFPSCPENEWKQIINGAETAIVACGSCKAVGSQFKTPQEWHVANKIDDRYSHATGVTIDAGRGFDKSVPGVLTSGITDLTVLHPTAPAVCGRFGVKFIAGDSISSDPIECDTLILGDHKSQYTLAAELNRWAKVVKKRIIIPADMASGCVQQVTQFMHNNREWSVYKHGAGWLCVTKDEADKVKPPALVSPASIYKFAKAIGGHLADGAKKVELAVYEDRLAKCDMCPARNNNRCGHCGCFVDAKAAIPKERCPIGEW